MKTKKKLVGLGEKLMEIRFKTNILIIICLFLIFPAVNIGTSKSIENNSSTSELEHSIDSSIIKTTQEQQILKNMDRFDGYFTENCGQLSNDDIRFYAQDNSVWFTDDGVWFELREYAEPRGQVSEVRSQEPQTHTLPNSQTPPLIHSQTPPLPNSQNSYNSRIPTTTHQYKRVILKQEFSEANDVRPVGVKRLSWNNNYFYGNDSSKWCTDVPNYQDIIYKNLYENIDLRYYSNDKGLKYDFVVHPGGEPNDIRLKYQGAQDLFIESSGSINICTEFGAITDTKLYIYQPIQNSKTQINGRFMMANPLTYGFQIIGKYDQTQDLVIDPLIYSTFIEGSRSDHGYGIEIDSSGNAYVTVHSPSSDFPNTTGAFDNTHNGFGDILVLKLNPTGSALVYSTYIGGNKGERPEGIQIDFSGNAYVTGYTDSSNFPNTTGAFDTTCNGGLTGDVFVLKLNPTGSALLYSTFIGGSSGEIGNGIQVDPSGNAYVAGYTSSSDFPNTTGAYDNTLNGYHSDVFILKLNPTGSDLIYSTYIGGQLSDYGYGIQIDSSGNAYVTGRTFSRDFPITPGAYDITFKGTALNVFVLKLNPTGSALLYSTYIGGSEYDGAEAIQIDLNGNAYVIGNTDSSDFPNTTGAYDTTHNGDDIYDSDVFVLKLNPTGSELLYSTYIGGNGSDHAEGIQVDSSGNAYVTGQTSSPDFPNTTNAYDMTYNGSTDVFVLVLNPTGSELLYSTFIGGDSFDRGYGIQIDSSCNAYVTGQSGSSDFPNTTGAYDTTLTSGSAVFVLKLQIPSSHLFLSAPNVAPISGNTTTRFNFTVEYLHLDNTAPKQMTIDINGIEHSMLEVDPLDKNYMDGKDYFFNITHLNIGNNTFKFRAFDGVNQINTMIFNLPAVYNTPPNIKTPNNLTAIEDTYYEIIFEYDDIDVANVGQSISWNFETNATWLAFNDINAMLYGTPTQDDIGEYWVNISINDTQDIDFTNFTLTVIDLNDNPIITTDEVTLTNEDELYKVDYNATDVDSPIGHQIWTLATNATTWLNINSTSGILKGRPGNDDVGAFWVNVSVNDGEGGADFANYTLKVLNVNDDPEIITEDILMAETDKLYELDFFATDIDSPLFEQTWTLETNATWLLINSSTGLVSGTPTIDDVGWYSVNVSVHDGDGGYDWHEFNITVLKGNLPPVITTADVEIAVINELYEVDYDATDDKPLVWLNWSLETNASWLELDNTTGVLSGTPTMNDGGKEYWVNISVSDGDNTRDHHNFTLKVLNKFKNNVPSLSNFRMTPTQGDTNTEFTFSFHYADADKDIPTMVQLVLDGIKYNMKLKHGEIPYDGQYEYNTTLSEGGHLYYFTASDGLDSSTSQTFITPSIKKPSKLESIESINTITIIILSQIILIVMITSFIAGTEVGKYKFLSLFFVPLYNRLHPENILNNYTRGQIHGYIKAKPGENYSAIKEALELNNGTLAYHAKVLEKEGYIYSERDGFRTRFYPKGVKKSEPDTIQKSLIDIVRQQPGISQHEIISLLDSDASQQVISYYLIKLSRNGTIKLEHNGRENRYSINYDETDSYPEEHQHQTQSSVHSPPSFKP